VLGEWVCLVELMRGLLLPAGLPDGSQLLVGGGESRLGCGGCRVAWDHCPIPEQKGRCGGPIRLGRSLRPYASSVCRRWVTRPVRQVAADMILAVARVPPAPYLPPASPAGEAAGRARGCN
jgi:hypothetical protein